MSTEQYLLTVEYMLQACMLFLFQVLMLVSGAAADVSRSLSHLVGFALKLRNLGLPDHGLIRELSSPLAGSLYSGEGHSRLYDDEAVYRYVTFAPVRVRRG